MKAFDMQEFDPRCDLKAIAEYAATLAQETESMVAKFMMEKNLKASQIRLCYDTTTTTGKASIWVEEK